MNRVNKSSYGSNRKHRVLALLLAFSILLSTVAPMRSQAATVQVKTEQELVDAIANAVSGERLTIEITDVIPITKTLQIRAGTDIQLMGGTALVMDEVLPLDNSSSRSYYLWK